MNNEAKDQCIEQLGRRLPLLITGLAGVAGFNTWKYFRRLFGEDQVIGQRPVDNWRLRGPGIVACDLENSKGITDLIRKYRFGTVLSCGGSCALKSCELDPRMAEQVNVVAVNSLMNALDTYENRLVHLSIDLVFSGVHGGRYVETDPVDPVTVYGSTMVQGESIVRNRRPDASILRISLPMGKSFNGHAGAIDWIQSRFSKGKPATLYYDEIRTPTYVECLNEVCLELLSNDLSGLFHAGGPTELSLYQIAQIINRVGGYAPELLHGCFRLEAGPVPPRAGNVTMDSNKLCSSLNRTPFRQWPLDAELFPLDRTWHFDRKGFKGSPRMVRELLYKAGNIRQQMQSAATHQ